jgi:hypothetical protein
MSAALFEFLSPKNTPQVKYGSSRCPKADLTPEPFFAPEPFQCECELKAIATVSSPLRRHRVIAIEEDL